MEFVLLANEHESANASDDNHGEGVHEESDHQSRSFEVEPPCWELSRPLFRWLPTRVIKKIFENTTQCAHMPSSTILKKRHKSEFLVLRNVKRRNKPVAIDTVHSDTPAIDGGETCAQIFVGTEMLVTNLHGMKIDKQFINTLEDNIRDGGP
jgi:hypothetical protein